MDMECFVENIVTDKQVTSDIKELIPDAGLRRRMSRILKSAVTTAIECAGGADGIEGMDAIITATGLGCLSDSERFLRNMIADSEQLLNPASFIQSTFNTAGGQIAMLRHNHCYNVTYVNRDCGFEDALLDALMRMADSQSRRVLVGAFDEQTPSQYRIMERMGFWRHGTCREGSVFTTLTAMPTDSAIAELSCMDFLSGPITEENCMKSYSGGDDAVLLTNDMEDVGLFPVVPARLFAEGVRKIAEGAERVIIYDRHGGDRQTVMVLKCIGH